MVIPQTIFPSIQSEPDVLAEALPTGEDYLHFFLEAISEWGYSWVAYYGLLPPYHVDPLINLASTFSSSVSGYRELPLKALSVFEGGAVRWWEETPREPKPPDPKSVVSRSSRDWSHIRPSHFTVSPTEHTQVAMASSSHIVIRDPRLDVQSLSGISGSPGAAFQVKIVVSS